MALTDEDKEWIEMKFGLLIQHSQEMTVEKTIDIICGEKGAGCKVETKLNNMRNYVRGVIAAVSITCILIGFAIGVIIHFIT